MRDCLSQTFSISLIKGGGKGGVIKDGVKLRSDGWELSPSEGRL